MRAVRFLLLHVTWFAGSDHLVRLSGYLAVWQSGCLAVFSLRLHACVWLGVSQDAEATLRALNPFAYEFASLSQYGNDGLHPQDYVVVYMWWQQLGLSRWIHESFPSTVRVCGVALWGTNSHVVKVVIDLCGSCEPCLPGLSFRRMYLLIMTALSLFVLAAALCWFQSSYRHDCCASFLVSKKRVRACPREMWQTLYDWLLNPVRPACPLVVALLTELFCIVCHARVDIVCCLPTAL